MDEVERTVQRGWSNVPGEPPWKPLPDFAFAHGRTLGYAKFRHEITPRINGLLHAGGANHVTAMLLRYHAALAGSTQWSLPVSHYELFRAALGCHNEGFASPLNARSLAMDSCKDSAGREVLPRYCSVFRDTDAAFHSLGDFFALEGPGLHGWVLNPPFSRRIMHKAALRAQEWLTRDPETVIVYVARQHNDGVDNENGSPASGYLYNPQCPYAPLTDHIVARCTLAPHEHWYLSHSGRPVVAKFATVVIVAAGSRMALDRHTARSCLRELQSMAKHQPPEDI
eukprot:TRINITY_DN16972_c0_g1_i1.p1 TRINITY_DN16972_c0_g1~~TRINITY_DN16972_c0_g1_i1.p1  ORF type:complete len:283 (+),score=55.94 TRINITY_DN16972_c0_g1_i1:385-1233(+)